MRNWDQLTNLIINNNYVREGVHVAKMLGARQIYVTGSSVYGALAAQAYGTKFAQRDVDVIVDRLRYPLMLPRGWTCTSTEYNDPQARHWSEEKWAHESPRINRGAVTIDLIEVHKLSGVRTLAQSEIHTPDSDEHTIFCGVPTTRPIDPMDRNIDHYLRSVGLDIQSIVYDVAHNKLWGTTGIEALESRMVGVNNINAAYTQAIRKQKSVEQYVEAVAEALDFGVQIANSLATNPR